MNNKIKVLFMCGIFSLGIVGCRNKEHSVFSSETATLNIAYQYGVAYTPAIIAKEQGLIEKEYEASTGKKVSVIWTQMNSGADINTGIASGDLDVGFMGTAPAITGVMKNVGYKIFTNLSGQEHSLITNNPSIKSLDDLVDSGNQIALVNIGSIQHIILAKALYNSGYNPHALDSNIVVMKHPDGMTALETGNVACHLTTNPYTYIERENAELYELDAVADAWSKEDSFIVGVASNDLYKNNYELYLALNDAIQEAVDYMNSNMEAAANLTYELDGNSIEDEVKYLQNGSYSVTTKNLFSLASFMAEAGFLDEAPNSYEDLVFDNVKGD